jgi:hypothetical protein
MTDGRHAWLRPAGLFVLATGLAILQPLILMAVPFAFLALGAPERTLGTVVAGIVCLWVIFGGAPLDGMWLLGRGWAVLLGGWFLALTLLRPEMRLTDRALAAVGGAFVGAAAVIAAQPQAWEVLDWVVKARILEGSTMAMSAMTTIRGGEGLPERVADALMRTADFQGRAFPAIVGLASLASLGVAWWVYTRLARGRGDGLSPLAGFRFNENLVWLLVGGVLLLALGLGDPWSRVGANALVFMGGLYALRGMAVVVALTGGVSVPGALLFFLGLVFLAPLILIGSLIIGLGDTWVDIRARGTAETG